MNAEMRLLLLGGLLLPLTIAAADTGDRGDTSQPTAVEAAAAPTVPAPPDTPRPSRASLKPMIDSAAERYSVERALVHAVIAAESAYDAHAISPAGAIGLMQVMPATAADYGVTDPSALFDPGVNVKTGTRHLKRLLGKYGNDYGRAIMAYNAGEGTVDRTGSNVTYAETLDYTAAVIRNYRRNGGKQPTEATMTKVAMLRGIKQQDKGRRLLKKYLDPSLLKLSVETALPVRYLDPGLHRAGPESRPMIVLESPKRK